MKWHRLLTVIVATLVFWHPPAQSAPFDARKEAFDGRESGVLTVNGMDVIEIRAASRDKSAWERAIDAANRLNELTWIHELDAEKLSLTMERGEAIIKHDSSANLPPHSILSVDRSLAALYPGTGGSPERLGQWWLALLQDHVALMQGQTPRFTLGTSVGEVLQRIAGTLDPTDAPYNSEELATALHRLSADESLVLSLASQSVPKDYNPDKAKMLARTATQPKTSPTRMKEAPAPSPTAAEGESPRPTDTPQPVRVVSAGDEAIAGGYKIGIRFDPISPVPEGETRVFLRLVSATSNQPVRDAMVVVRVQESDGTVWNPSRPVRFHANGQEYATEVTFRKEGKHTIHVGLWTVGQQPLAVGFIVEVKGATPAKSGEPAKVVVLQAKVEKNKEVSGTITPDTTGTAPASSTASADKPSASDGAQDQHIPDALRSQVSFEKTEAGLLKINWLQTEPRPSRAVFILKNEAGLEFARQTDATEPFFGIFKNFSNAKTIEVQLQYANGVSASVVIPFPQSAPQ